MAKTPLFIVFRAFHVFLKLQKPCKILAFFAINPPKMLLLLDRLSTKSACRQQNTMPSKDESRIALRALCIRSTSTFWAKTLDPALKHHGSELFNLHLRLAGLAGPGLRWTCCWLLPLLLLVLLLLSARYRSWSRTLPFPGALPLAGVGGYTIYIK